MASAVTVTVALSCDRLAVSARLGDNLQPDAPRYHCVRIKVAGLRFHPGAENPGHL